MCKRAPIQSVQKPKCDIILGLRYSFSTFVKFAIIFQKSEPRKKVAELCSMRDTICAARALFRQHDLFFSHCDLFPSAIFLTDYYILYFGDHNHVNGTLG